MVAITAPNAPGRLARFAAASRKAAFAPVRRLLTPHKVALRNLADIPFTVLGAAGIDFAAWHISHGWGWLVTGVSLIVVEHLIADEAD